MRPRMAFSAVVFPAPLGPMIPRMRPSPTRRSIPSSATVAPYALRRPRASMHAIASALLVRGAGRRLGRGGVQQLFGGDAEPPDGGVDARPLLLQEALALARQQQRARARPHEHPA